MQNAEQGLSYYQTILLVAYLEWAWMHQVAVFFQVIQKYVHKHRIAISQIIAYVDCKIG